MLIHSGSVKDIYEVGPEAPNELLFKFTDRYSIFDWGKMPDEIPGKGLALARMGKILFEEISKQLLKTHYLGPGRAEDEIRVKRVMVPRGAMDFYRDRPLWTLIPLEVIYRFGVPKGSSLLKRSNEFYEGQEFITPLLDYTTKLERTDRVLTPEEAKMISGMSDQEWRNLRDVTAKIGQYIKKRFSELGLKLWDGKLEFAFGDRMATGSREIILVDTIGLDEMRLTLEGMPLSKEILRQFYLNTDWYRTLSRAKKDDSEHFKERMVQDKILPENLPAAVIQAVGAVYSAVSDLLAFPPGSQRDACFDRIRNALQTIQEAE